jgi:hypothetical protein
MILDFRWEIRHEDHEKRREVKYTKEGVREYAGELEHEFYRTDGRWNLVRIG